jgi:hypothetical protein
MVRFNERLRGDVLSVRLLRFRVVVAAAAAITFLRCGDFCREGMYGEEEDEDEDDLRFFLAL